MSQSLDCPGFECWQALLDCTLSTDQQERFERHLQSCPVCQEKLDWIEEDEETFHGLAQQVGDPTDMPLDQTLSQVMDSLYAVNPEAGAEGPADLHFLSPSDRPGVLGTLGGYEVEEVIGQGGMGIVLKAFDPALKRLVAIKVLSPTLAGSATARKRFTREAKAVAAVSHEHIVAIHGVHDRDGLPYLVMQYIAGESLQARLDRLGSLDVLEIVRIGLQTASGLAAAHAQGLIHRDIKPANLLLAACGLAQPTAKPQAAVVKITDFGLARLVDDVTLTQNGVVAGTPEYMAPEQARGEPLDSRADLFSLGSVLYALCAGSPPFRASSVAALLRQVSEREPTSLRARAPEVPVWLETLIARLMAKDPADRFQSAAEVAQLLEEGLAHLCQPATVPAPAVLPLADLGSSRPKTRALSGVLGAAGLGLALLLLAALGLGLDFWLAGNAAGTPGELKARFYQDLRTAEVDNPLLRQMDEGLRWGPAGARVFLSGDNPWARGALATTFEVQGDFEITVSYEIDHADRPLTGYGNGVYLYAALDPSTDDAVSLARRILPNGRTVFVSNRMRPINGRKDHNVKAVPSTATTGKLRLVRSGSKVRCLAAEGDDPEFVQVDEVEFGTDEVRIVQWGGNTGGGNNALDARFLDITIRAEQLPGYEQAEEPPGRLRSAVRLSLGIVLALGVVLGVWLYLRRNRRSSGENERAQAGQRLPLWLWLPGLLGLPALSLAFVPGDQPATPPERGGEERVYDFRGQPLPPGMDVIGHPQAEQFVQGEAEGLRVRLPRDRDGNQGVVLSMPVETEGDFDITLAFEVLRAEEPPPGVRSYGVGVLMSVNEAARIGRLARANGNQVVSWDRWDKTEVTPKFLSGASPGTGNVGRLRLKRLKPTLHFLWAPGTSGDHFEEIYRCEFGEDLTLLRLEFAADEGGLPGALDVRLFDLRIRGAQPDSLPQQRTRAGKGWVLLALGIAFLVLGALGVWHWLRPGKRSA
jgi:hypothetical protein